MLETLKDYAIKALVNTVDHLGSVTYKVNTFLDGKIGEVHRTELRFFCIEQVVFQIHIERNSTIFSNRKIVESEQPLVSKHI